MTAIVGGLLTLVVIVLTGVLVREFRGMLRLLDAHRRAARLSRRPADTPEARRSALTIITNRRPSRTTLPWPTCGAALSGLCGVLVTSMLFVLFGPRTSASTADAPAPPEHPGVATSEKPGATVTITVQQDRPAAVTIVRTPHPDDTPTGTGAAQTPALRTPAPPTLSPSGATPTPGPRMDPPSPAVSIANSPETRPTSAASPTVTSVPSG